MRVTVPGLRVHDGRITKLVWRYLALPVGRSGLKIVIAHQASLENPVADTVFQDALEKVQIERASLVRVLDCW